MNTLTVKKLAEWAPNTAMQSLYQEIKKLDYHGAALEAAREVHNQIERLEQSLQELADWADAMKISESPYPSEPEILVRARALLRRTP